MAAGATYTPIASTTIGTAVASYTFSSIPATYTDLVLIENITLSAAGNQSVVSFGDTSTLYSSTNLQGSGTSALSSRYTAGSGVGSSPGAGSGTEIINIIRQFQNYSNTTTYKTFIQRSNWAGGQVYATVGLWRNTAAISSIVLTTTGGNYAVGSTFALYGITAA